VRGTVGAGPRLPRLLLSERLTRTKSGHRRDDETGYHQNGLSVPQYILLFDITIL